MSEIHDPERQRTLRCIQTIEKGINNRFTKLFMDTYKIVYAEDAASITPLNPEEAVCLDYLSQIYQDEELWSQLPPEDRSNFYNELHILVHRKLFNI